MGVSDLQESKRDFEEIIRQMNNKSASTPTGYSNSDVEFEIGEAAPSIEHVAEKIEEELGETPTVVATGGLSKEIIVHCKRNIIYSENLLLDGLRAIYEKNN